MTINARLTSLQRQHSELEDEIRARQADLSEDTLDIWTLKRKNLLLKSKLRPCASRQSPRRSYDLKTSSGRSSSSALSSAMLDDWLSENTWLSSIGCGVSAGVSIGVTAGFSM